MTARIDVASLRFDPGPDCAADCTLTDGYCDLSCMFAEPEPLLWNGDDA